MPKYVKLPDTVAACNLIKTSRKNNRTYLKCKSVSTKLEGFEGLTANLNVMVRTSTGTVTCVNYLHWRGRVTFSPKTKQKLRCRSKHALRYVYMHRKRAEKRNNLLSAWKAYNRLMQRCQ